MRGVVVGHPVAEGGLPSRGRNALGGREQVLDADRHAAERPRVAGANGVRLGQRALGAERDERVQLGVQPLDRGERRLDQLARRDLAGADERGLLDGAQLAGRLRPVIAGQSLRATSRRPPAHALHRRRSLPSPPVFDVDRSVCLRRCAMRAGTQLPARTIFLRPARARAPRRSPRRARCGRRRRSCRRGSRRGAPRCAR